MRPIPPLDEHVQSLLAFVDSPFTVPKDAPFVILNTTDSRVEFLSDDGGAWDMGGSQLISLEEFQGPFEEILLRGYPWVNLSLFGTYDGSVVVGVEVPNQAPGRAHARTSVNYSGPALAATGGPPNWSLRLKDHG